MLGSGNWIGGGRHKPCTVVSANCAFDEKECLVIFRVSSAGNALQLSRESPIQICRVWVQTFFAISNASVNVGYSYSCRTSKRLNAAASLQLDALKWHDAIAPWRKPGVS